MKKLIFTAMIAFMMLSFFPSQTKAANNTKKVAPTIAKSDVAIEAVLAARLDEIVAMDKSSLSKTEKKELKSEVKAIRSAQDGLTVTHHHHGVYYGLGGVLLIVLIVVLIV